MRRFVIVLPLVTALSGCLFVVPLPSGSGGGGSTNVQVGDRNLTVRRSHETFELGAPVNVLAEDGITLAAATPLRRGTGEPAIVVSGTTQGELGLAEDAVMLACGVARGQAGEMGLVLTNGRYDTVSGDQMWPMARCPALDG